MVGAARQEAEELWKEEVVAAEAVEVEAEAREECLAGCFEMVQGIYVRKSSCRISDGSGKT